MEPGWWRAPCPRPSARRRRRELSAVGNLSYDLTDQDVIDHFSQVGPVKHVRCVPGPARIRHCACAPIPRCERCPCSIVTDRDTGKPRGFGFIEFFDIPTAESAIRNLSGKDFKGRTIRCAGLAISSLLRGSRC